MARNWQRDMEICKQADAGPWMVYDDGYSLIIRSADKFVVAETNQISAADKANTRFIAEAREGWPEAIRRAMEAEERAHRLEEENEGLKAIIEHDKLVLELKEANELERRVRELEAQCAIMREALTECISALELCRHEELCKIAISPYDMINNAKQFLSTTAGLELLERIKKLEAVAEVTKVYKEVVNGLIYALHADWRDKNEQFSIINSWLRKINEAGIELEQALAALVSDENK